jgi:hypothetical protein
MSGVRLAALGFLLSVMTVVLKRSGFAGDRIFALVCTVGIISLSGEGVSRLMNVGMGAISENVREDAKAIFKIVGTGYAFGICSDACLELDERGIASAVSLAGRVEILLLALPYIERIFSLGARLLSGA